MLFFFSVVFYIGSSFLFLITRKGALIAFGEFGNFFFSLLNFVGGLVPPTFLVLPFYCFSSYVFFMVSDAYVNKRFFLDRSISRLEGLRSSFVPVDQEFSAPKVWASLVYKKFLFDQLRGSLFDDGMSPEVFEAECASILSKAPGER